MAGLRAMGAVEVAEPVPVPGLGQHTWIALAGSHCSQCSFLCFRRTKLTAEGLVVVSNGAFCWKSLSGKS